jgi:RNA polymerase sigma-70 factor (ECF subfamily)
MSGMAAEMDAEDRELLRRTREGDAEAFGRFLRARSGVVLGFLRPRVGSAEVAADLMCETFAQALVVVHDHSRDLPPVPVAWLVTIARNELIDSIRGGRVADTTRQRLALERIELSDRDLAAVEDAGADADALAQLRAALLDELQQNWERARAHERLAAVDPLP